MVTTLGLEQKQAGLEYSFGTSSWSPSGIWLNLSQWFRCWIGKKGAILSDYKEEIKVPVETEEQIRAEDILELYKIWKLGK